MSTYLTDHFNHSKPSLEGALEASSPCEQTASLQQSGQLSVGERLQMALQRFTSGFSTPVVNPLVTAYGDAYRLVVEADALVCLAAGEAVLQQQLADDSPQLHSGQVAIEKYRQAIALRPDFLEAYHALGRYLQRQGNTLAAIEVYEQSLEQNQFQADIHGALGKCYSENGYLQRAIRHFKRAIKLNASLLDAHFGLALVYELDEQPEQAIKSYEALLQQDANYLPAINNLGSTHLRLANYHQAEALFRQLIEQSPKFARGYLGLALTLDKSGRGKEALPYYLEALQLKPKARNSSYIHQRIVEINEGLGRSRKTTTQQTLVLVKG
ncbi:MAG: tetratricopeptide repeat protein [Candidatus Melainabacteria bacterium]|nr:tetratricopeptide repeat protein [Candidatus Melainabacteria bacterium]